jgi:preprotein translocase subunit SecG
MQVLNIFHVLIAISLVAMVLVQRGQGATAGAAFGSGASGTVFGSRGAGTFLTRTTWVLAALFCAISLTMAVVVSRTSAVPETDLGVVSSAPATPEAAEEQLETTIPLELQPQLDSDVPESDIPVLEPGAELMISEEAADDMPALDSAVSEPDDDQSDEGGEGTEPGPGADGT